MLCAALTLAIAVLAAGCTVPDANLSSSRFQCDLSVSTCPSGFQCTPEGYCAPQDPVNGGGEGEGEGEGEGGGIVDVCPPDPNEVRPTLAAGAMHACAIQGTDLYCWGYNEYGQVGVVGEPKDWTHPPGTKGCPCALAPTPLPPAGCDEVNRCAERPLNVGQGKTWIHVSAGGSHTCAITSQHELYCWGKNENGQLGDGTTEQPSFRAPLDKLWSWVSCGGSFTCGIQTDRSLHCWGNNSLGGVGIGGWDQTVPDPTPVGDPDFSWIAVTAGHMHACAIRDDGALWCWGSAGFGEHGTGADLAPHIPMSVAGGSCWRETALDMFGTCAIDEARALQCFGREVTGRFAADPRTLLPCKSAEDQNCLGTPSPSGATGPWRTATISMFHGCGIRTDGSLWCWGGNTDTERPFGTPNAEVFPPIPIQIPGAEEPWSEVSTFQNGTCVRDAWDRIWCTGRNRNGELGRVTDSHIGGDFDLVELPE